MNSRIDPGFADRYEKNLKKLWSMSPAEREEHNAQQETQRLANIQEAKNPICSRCGSVKYEYHAHTSAVLFCKQCDG